MLQHNKQQSRQCKQDREKLVQVLNRIKKLVSAQFWVGCDDPLSECEALKEINKKSFLSILRIELS